MVDGGSLRPMKLVTWNCRIGGFRRKARRVSPLRPDVLVVQEVEPIDANTVFAGDSQPTFRDRVSDPAYPRRSVGVFSYTDTRLEACDLDAPEFCFRRYEAQHGGLAFNVVGVWTAPTTPRALSYRQAHEGVKRHAEWIRRRPTVIMGDFNENASYGSGKAKGRSWSELLDLLRPLGLVSAYHEKAGESFGAETRPTHFHRGQKERGFHLDYCFVPSAWMPRVTRVEVGAFDEWCDVSDHAPLIVDVDL